MGQKLLLYGITYITEQAQHALKLMDDEANVAKSLQLNSCAYHF